MLYPEDQEKLGLTKWRDKAIWSKIPASHRDRAKNQFAKDWADNDTVRRGGGEAIDKILVPYVNNWLANYKDENIDKEGAIVDSVVDNENMRNIHEQLKKAKFLKGKALDYDTFANHAKNNPEYRMKIHEVLRAKGMESNDIDFNTFNTRVFGDESNITAAPGSSALDDMPFEEQEKIAKELGMTVEEMLADPTAQAMFTRAQADNTSVEIEGVPVDIQAQLQGNEKAQGTNDYENKLIAQQEAYDEIFAGGANAIPLLPDGTVDYNALNAKIKEIKGFTPNIRIAKQDSVIEDFDFDTQLNLDANNIMVPDLSGERDSISGRSKIGGKWDTSTNRAIKALQPFVKAGFSFEESEDPDDMSGQTESLLITAPNGETLNIQPTFSNQQTILDFLKNNNQLISAADQRANQRKLIEYYDGEIDLTTEELAEISVIDPEVKDYVMSKMPENSRIDNKDDFMGTINPNTGKKYTEEEAYEAEYEAFQQAYKSTFDKAVHGDPRYEFAVTQAREATDKLSQDYINELREKYADENGLVSEENMTLMQEEFSDWYNETTSENLKNNKVAKRLFQDYGLASAELYGERFRSFERYNYDTWLDDNVYREIDESLSKDQSWWNKAWQKLRNSAASVPAGVRTVSNTIEIALQKEFELEGRAEIYNSIKDGIENGDLTEDMSLAEARKVNEEIDSWMKWNILSGWSEDDSLKDFYAKRKERYDNTVRDLTEDLGDLSQQERYAGFAEEYADLELDGFAPADWFINSAADMIKQAPHMVPSTLGGIMITAGTIAAGSGVGAGAAPYLLAGGKASLAIGSGVMAAQVYADVYMQGLRRQMEEQYGEGGFSTEDYLDALANDEYGAQMPALTAAVLTGASEYVMGKLGAGITGNVSKNILRSTAGNKILGATFMNYARGAASYAAASTVDGVIEGATEGFQSYMAQVAENAMNLYVGDMADDDVSSIFYKNIDVDEIIEEAKLGFNMGIFMGTTGTFLGQASSGGGNYNNLNYEGRAMQIAENYDISGFDGGDPGSGFPPPPGGGGGAGSISNTANQAFIEIQDAVKLNPTLKPNQKRNIIQTVSDIREAAMKVPKTVTGRDKKALIDLLRQKKMTESEIKKINDKSISSAQGLDSRLSQINTDIEDIIKNNINNKPTTRNQIVPPRVMDAIFNNVSRFAGVQNLVDPRDHANYIRQGVEQQKQREIDMLRSIADDDRRDGGGGGGAGLAVIDNLIEQNREIGNRILRARNEQQLEARKTKIQNLETQNSADELRAQLENATGENRQDIELALQEKFKNFPQAVEDSGVDIYTGQQEGRDKTPDVRDIVARDDSYRAIDRLMNDPDFDIESTLDQRRALKAAAPVIEATLNRLYRPGSLLTREQFRKALENKYLETLLKYDVDQDINQQGAGQQTSNLFNIKAGEIARENLGKGESASLDREDARQVADTTQEQDLDQDQTVGTREKVYSSQTEQVQDQDVSETKAVIKDELQKDILLSAAKGDNAATTASIIKQSAKSSYFKQLRKDIGTFASQAYKDFVNAIDQAFIKSLPAATIKRRFGKLFGIKQIGTTPTKQVGKTGKMSYFNKPIYSIPQVTEQGLQEFKEYFLGGEKRQQSLYQILANDFALESINELMQDKDFMQKLETALADSGITAVEFMESLENKLDPRTKEDTSLDVVDAPTTQPKAKQKTKSKIDTFIERKLDPQIKKFGGSFGSGITPGSFAQALKTALKAYQQGVKAGKSFIDNIKAFIKSFKQAFKGPDKLTEAESKFVDKEVKKRFKKPEDMTQAALDNLINDMAQKFNVDRGIGYEKAIYKAANKAAKSIPGFEVVGQQTEKGEGRDFDIRAKLWGFAFNVEAKLEKAIYGSANGIYDFVKNTFNYSKQSEKMRKENKALADKLDRLLEKSKTKLDDFKRFAEALGFDLKKSGVVMDRDTYDNLIKITSTTFGKENITGDDLAAIYNAKGVYYIQIKGEGLYYLGENPLGLPIPKFEGTAELSMRIKAGTVEVKGAPNDRRITIVMDPTNFKRTGPKSDFSIDTEAGISKLMATPEVELLRQQRETTGDNAELAPDIVNKNSQNVKQTFLQSLKARIKGLKIFKDRKGLSAFDLDDTLALTKEKVLYTMPDGTTGELTAGEFAVQYEGLLAQGAEFDYKNFDNVSLETQKGPLAGTALRRQGKYGPKDIFVVTARPQASQQAIKVFLDKIGLNIPIDNIITLEDGSPQAKADWFIGKAAEGYNDFYFADDSALNVQQVKDILDQLDVKSRVQQAIVDKATRLDQEMNEILEDKTGIKADEDISDVRAKLEGKKKDKGFFRRLMKQLTITASADDFLGLVQYIVGKGETGTRQQKWIRDNLLTPYNKAEQALISAKINVAKDFNTLKQAFPTLRNKKGLKGMFTNPLSESIGVGPYNKSQAVRVYLWNKQGMEIPGMSQRDIDALVEAVSTDFELKQFADKIQEIQKEGQYPAPTAYWIAGDIKSDILSSLDKGFRKELLTEWKDNVDIIFSPKNMNKLEAAFGSKYVEALRDSLRRMETGSNRPTYNGSGSRQVNEMMDWLNGSVAVAMFLNMRSGTLQMLSNVNFINWGDNNIYAAAKAFLSKDYVPTVMKLMNSDYLVNRRDGLKINVNEAELAAAAKKGGFKGMLAYLLDKGFVLTRIFDSLAIATGGATFYMNRQKSLLNRINEKTGKKYTKAEAEQQAFDDFYAIAEETQQSSNPSKISSQQASFFGRLILSFQNVTMQYNRKAKKMLLDLVNRRRRPGMTQRESDLSNLSGVIYYVAVQNLIFNSLQQALFAVAFDDEEEKDRNKTADTINGMVDSILFGLGFGGAIISTVKNVIRELDYQAGKKTPEYEEAIFNLFDISPVIDTKVRNIRNGLRTFSWDMKAIKERGWSLDNPAYIAISSIISGATNIPIDRLFRKINNIRQATDENVRTFERIALLLGWSGWNFGLPYWGRESTIKQEAAN